MGEEDWGHFKSTSPGRSPWEAVFELKFEEEKAGMAGGEEPSSKESNNFRDPENKDGWTRNRKLMISWLGLWALNPSFGSC